MPSPYFIKLMQEIVVSSTYQQWAFLGAYPSWLAFPTLAPKELEEEGRHCRSQVGAQQPEAWGDAAECWVSAGNLLPKGRRGK